MLDLSKLTTEQRNPDTMELDTFTPLQIAQAMNAEDARAIDAVKQVLPQVAIAIEWASEALRAGGRILYVGAGTSGRLGVLDSVECPPTFGVSPEIVVGIIAGGEGAFVKATEGAEDDVDAGASDLDKHGLTSRDIVIGIAASGRTPYVIGALAHAHELGCHTVGIACNEGSRVGTAAELAIEPVTGPEVLTGSTRLKAGTAQKTILNMISTGAMVRTGKVYQNLMVDVQQTNEKLHVRARNIVVTACGCTPEEAEQELCAADGSAKVAIVSLLLGCGVEEAKAALAKSGGHVRKAL